MKTIELENHLIKFMIHFYQKVYHDMKTKI